MFPTKWIFETKISTDIFPLHFETLFPTHPFFGPVFGARFLFQLWCNNVNEPKSRRRTGVRESSKGGDVPLLCKCKHCLLGVRPIVKIQTRENFNCLVGSICQGMRKLQWANSKLTCSHHIRYCISFETAKTTKDSQKALKMSMNKMNRQKTFSSGLCVPHWNIGSSWSCSGTTTPRENIPYEDSVQVKGLLDVRMRFSVEIYICIFKLQPIYEFWRENPEKMRNQGIPIGTSKETMKCKRTTQPWIRHFMRMTSVFLWADLMHK